MTSFFFPIFVKKFTMINAVRNTVLSVLNKNNYGYLSPSDFNLFAKQAQLDIFENYFYEYNYQINKENARQSGDGYADITKSIEEAIDLFSETKGLTQNFESLYFAPSQTTTGCDYYLLNKVLIIHYENHRLHLLHPWVLNVQYVQIECKYQDLFYS